MSTVYLIHFECPLGSENPRGKAQHYLGTADNLAGRLYHHRNGTGARLMAAVTRAGIAWEVARTWEGGRTLERKLKNRHNARRLCPLCRKRSKPCPGIKNTND